MKYEGDKKNMEEMILPGPRDYLTKRFKSVSLPVLRSLHFLLRKYYPNYKLMKEPSSFIMTQFYVASLHSYRYNIFNIIFHDIRKKLPFEVVSCITLFTLLCSQCRNREGLYYRIARGKAYCWECWALFDKEQRDRKRKLRLLQLDEIANNVDWGDALVGWD